MTLKTSQIYIAFFAVTISAAACKLPAVASKTTNTTLPPKYNTFSDTANISSIRWRDFFKDSYLTTLIDTALANNQEMNSMLQEINISTYEIRARKGEYLPFVGINAGSGVDKVARYTNIGAMEANTQIKPGTEMPDPLPNHLLAAQASWEVDIWHKLRNAKKSAVKKYLSTIEGKNYFTTTLIAEVATSYFELLSLDNQLLITESNIDLQRNALNVVKLQKEATRVTELGVKKFEAEVLKTQSKLYAIQQQITETENHINYLLGRYPQPITRGQLSHYIPATQYLPAGIPSQLLDNRPDIKKAELELQAAKIDIQIAKANFYPSLRLNASLGYKAFNPAYLLRSPQSMLYTLAGDVMAPLINRNAIKAAYLTASARQIQAVYHYQQTVLNAYLEVANQIAKINNLRKSYDLQAQQVQALTQSTAISGELFKSARADYMEVLMTQRDALESKYELIETQKQQLFAMVSIYQALGGGWQ